MCRSVRMEGNATPTIDTSRASSSPAMVKTGALRGTHLLTRHRARRTARRRCASGAALRDDPPPAPADGRGVRVPDDRGGRGPHLSPNVRGGRNPIGGIRRPQAVARLDDCRRWLRRYTADRATETCVTHAPGGGRTNLMDSDITIRKVDPDEWEAFCRVAELVFGDAMTDERRAMNKAAFEFDRGLTAEDGGELVATGGAYSLDLTLPGLTTIPVGGLTWISVLPTHRRRGILRRMVERHFDDVLQRGELASILIASESSIYGRFGYGPATQIASYEIDLRHASFARPAGGSGRVRALGGDEALKLL